jgi:hypothetical protein
MQAQRNHRHRDETAIRVNRLGENHVAAAFSYQLARPGKAWRGQAGKKFPGKAISEKI